MPRIPLPKGFDESENLPRTKRVLLNGWNDGNGRFVGRPGITQRSTTGKVARGNFVWNGDRYNVVSQTLIKFTNNDTGAFVDIGPIEGSASIQTAVGFNDAVIVVDASDGKTYTLSNSTTLININAVLNVGGIAAFNHIGSNPAVGNTVTISGFVINTLYNVTGIVTTVNSTNTAITSVTNNGGIAVFNHAGTSPAVGEGITISGFVTNTAYNVAGVVTLSTATTFEISSIAFGTDETGSFTLKSFEISSIAFGSNEVGGKFTLVLADVSGNANFVPFTDVTHINGRFIYVPFSGDPAKFSDVGAAGTIQPLSFFDAEELPDKNNGCFNLRNVLYITGTDSIESFRDSGATPNPFLRVNGARLDNGFIGALLEYNATFLFIGREKDQDFGIYAVAQGVAPKISNQGIDLILSTYAIEELEAAIPGRIKWRGFDIATFTLKRDSFGYFGGEWFLLDTIFSNRSKPWGAGFIAQFEGKYYTAFDDKVGVFENIATDYGNRITRRILTGIEEENGDFMTFQKVQLGISQGFNAGEGSVALKLTRDNVTFGQPVYRKTADIGKYADHLEWNYPGGLGTYHGFLGIEFFTTEDILSSVEYMIVE